MLYFRKDYLPRWCGPILLFFILVPKGGQGEVFLILVGDGRNGHDQDLAAARTTGLGPSHFILGFQGFSTFTLNGDG